MKQFLLILTWGLVIWGLSLVWPYVNTALTPQVADAIIVGLVVGIAAYALGRQFTRSEAAETVEPVAETRGPTRPFVPIVYPFGRTRRSTRPIPELTGRAFHSRATQPVLAIQGRVHHSRITRPMPIGR
jgi:hypothetical protein